MTGQPLPPPGGPPRPATSDNAALVVMGFILAAIAAGVLGGWRWVGAVVFVFGVTLVVTGLIAAIRSSRR